MARILIICNHRKLSPDVTAITASFPKRTGVDYAYWSDLLYHYKPPSSHVLHVFTHEGKRKTLSQYDAIYLRAFYPKDKDIQHILVREARALGIPCIGSVPDVSGNAVWGKTDALHFTNRAFGIVYPETYFGHGSLLVSEFDKIAKRIGSPLVCKPNTMYKGRGVELITSKRALNKTQKETATQFGKHRVYFQLQKHLPVDADYRILAVGKKTYCMKRQSNDPKEFRHNVTLGGSVSKATLPKSLHRLSIRAAKAMGQDIVGADFLLYKGTYYCLEINKTPGLSGISQANDADIWADVADLIIDTIKKKKR